MREKFIHALSVSIEWRVLAFIVTNIFFLFTMHSFWEATGLALLLQGILFAAHTLWYFTRIEHGFSMAKKHESSMSSGI